MSNPPLVAIIDFHHTRGPEVEKWINVPEGTDPAAENGWSLLPFLALPDGAHATEEAISYFTLRKPAPGSTVVPKDSKTEASEATSPTQEEKMASKPLSLFGISCTRQLDANELKARPADVTRSSVQKAVVAVVDSPFLLRGIREKLRAASKAWFDQREFKDVQVLEDLHESIVATWKDDKQERDQFVGLSLRDIIHDYKWQILTLFKCVLLQPKILIFGSDCERLCLLQFTLISLIPGLIHQLRDCADPNYDAYVETLSKPTSLKSSDRGSLLSYMGLPLALFGKGALFSPYTCLQQMDDLGEKGTKSYIVGSTNGLFIRQKDKYSDVLINLDEHTIDITSPTLKNALQLTIADRRWIDFITKSVNDTWDEENPTRPNNHGYAGSEEFIKLQFEEYLLALISSVKYRQHQEKQGLRQSDDKDPEDQAHDFGEDFLAAWQQTDNFTVLQKYTEPDLYNVVEPKHPTAGGLTIDDIQRRLTQQVADLHLDERLRSGRDVVGAQLAMGQQKVSSAFNKVWGDLEVLRDNQRRRAEDRRSKAAADTPAPDDAGSDKKQPFKSPDLAQAQASVQAAGAKAGAYLSSWGAWASEKRRSAWPGRASPGATSPVSEAPEAAARPSKDGGEVFSQSQPPSRSGPESESAGLAAGDEAEFKNVDLKTEEKDATKAAAGVGKK